MYSDHKPLHLPSREVSRLDDALVRCCFPLKQIEYGVYGDPIIIDPEPYPIYLRGTISYRQNLPYQGALEGGSP